MPTTLRAVLCLVALAAGTGGAVGWAAARLAGSTAYTSTSAERDCLMTLPFVLAAARSTHATP